MDVTSSTTRKLESGELRRLSHLERMEEILPKISYIDQH
jgi:hypothetical protein